MKFSNIISSLSIIVLTVAVSTAESATIHVPADQPTIQAGIDAAVPGDIVLVADGTYTGPGNRDIDFGGKNIVLKSENGSEATIIDCEGSSSDPHRGFTFHGGEDSSAVVDGFTIQGGYAPLSTPAFFPSYGGGIYCLGSNPTIKNNIIRGNSATHGGGIACTISRPTITNNIISSNAGSGIYCETSSPSIYGNTITLNTTLYSFGGIYCYNSNPQISHNIVTFNDVSIVCVRSNPNLICCDVYGNERGDWVGCIADQAGINGNFSLDPLFCDAASGDFSLRDHSPCAPDNNSCGELIGALDIGCVATDIVDNDDLLPNEFSLSQNYPNPFNPKTIIEFSLPQKSNVKLTVYNVLGQRMNVLVDKVLSAGKYTVTWDGTDYNGLSVASGIYFYRLETDGFLTSRKMVLLK